ncbi:MAG TPA: glutamate--tRNA ligase [Candidatus Hydrogenedentes bacterium]|nr:glutamate--tRNA ligase [Candidatus Hydrogenedentota bacterium]
MSNTRCRIAPSPSGFLHIGTAKTALYNWLFAKKTGGVFILRLEDTDAERTDEQYVHGMCEGFRWLGIEWDEGPEFGGVPEKGAYGPYRQSQRRELYRAEALRLLDEGKAYKCFCTKEEIDAFRKDRPHDRFMSPWRDAAPSKVAAMGDAPSAVRFKVPEGETVLHDVIQGEVRWNNREYDDFVILKPNGDPIFHLAVVVDDAHMKITHVIRGDDHLTNAARHVMLFEALGFPLPQYAHHPLVHDEQGRKLSKRMHGANVLDWRDDGYLPEAIINYIALLGWTSEEENREFFTLDELKDHFTLERLTKSAARFDRKKLDWLNGQHIRRLSVEDFRDRILPILEAQGFDVRARTPEWLTRVAEICQGKIPTLNQIVQQTDFFFRPVTPYEEAGVKKHFHMDGRLCLEAVLGVFASTDDWTSKTLHDAVQALADRMGTGLRKLVHPIRLALTGKTVGPGLFELAELLGKKTCLERIEDALAYIAALDEL